jgi:hypothetical protein
MKLIPDLKEFLDLLISENVQYLVIGGWAYNSYAEPRFTGDLDIFVSGLPVRYISLDDLIKNKSSTGRDKDILDAKNLQKFKCKV